MQPGKIVDFKSHEEEIIKALESKRSIIDASESLSLAGFTMISVQQNLDGGISLGGPSIPAVVVVGNSTGRIYQIALKVLLPDLEI